MQRQPRLHEVAHLVDAEAAVGVEERRALEDAHRADVHRVLEPLQVQEAGVERGQPVVLASSAAMRTGARSLRSTAHAPRRDRRLDDLARAGARARRAARAARRQLRQRLADLARRRRRPITLEWRLHPVAGYRTPARRLALRPLGDRSSTQLSHGGDPHALRLGDEVRPLTGLWDGLECFAAYGDELEPQQLARAGHRRARPRRPTASASSTTTRSATRGSAPTARSRSSRCCSSSSS